MIPSIKNVEGFDPTEWDIRRKGRVWSHEEFERRIYQAPEKIEYTAEFLLMRTSGLRF